MITYDNYIHVDLYFSIGVLSEHRVVRSSFFFVSQSHVRGCGLGEMVNLGGLVRDVAIGKNTTNQGI